EAAGLRLADQTVAVLDLSDVAARLLGHPLPAILGREIFDAARLQIDIAGGTVAVVTEDTEPPGQRLPLTTEHGIETFPVRVEGHAPVQAAFDLGNGSNVLIGADYARRAGLLDDQRAVTRERGGGIGGETERAVIRLAEIEVAGRTFRDVPASIEESESANDLNVGIAVLEHFLITTDFRERSLWLLPRN
ncbi:MAG TPA: aspartyl protease family protein, partial [Steroidobacteraceae bacterium]|nr:aspartyl protease family protein [Steroidobacteraceae bacterium]